MRSIIALGLILATLFGIWYFISSDSHIESSSQTVDLQSLHRASIAEAAKPYTELITNGNPKSALSALYADQVTDSITSSLCHEIGHEIGRSVFEYHGSISSSFMTQDVTCNGGYVHGVLEAAFDGKENVPEIVETACPNADPAQFQDWQCIHGVGHGVMFAKRQEILPALKACEHYKSRDAQAACTNGALMQHFTLELTNQTDSELLELCKTLSVPESLDCYTYAPIAYLERYPSDFNGAFEWCQVHSAGNYQKLCRQGVIYEAAKRNISNLDAVIALCQHNSLSDTQCTNAIVAMYLNHTADLNSAESLCSDWPLGETYCLEATQNHMLNAT